MAAKGADRSSLSARLSRAVPAEARSRPISSPSVRFTLGDGAVAAGVAAVEVLFAGSRRTTFGRLAVPVLTALISLPVAIETTGYTRAAAISGIAASAAIVTAEAAGEFGKGSGG